jgi:Family of unknown function (DUF5681)
MSEKFNPTDGEELKPQSGGSDGAPAEEYRVGPGRPPTDTRWKKGGSSPNPTGRPRKDQSMLPDARKAFEQAISKKVLVPRGDKKVLMTRIEIGLEQLLNQFAKGDRHARRDLMEYADKLGIDFLAKHRQTLEQGLTPNYQAILDGFLARRSGAANVAPAPHVLASPELLDDDAAESEPALSSRPKAQIEPEPPQKPSVNDSTPVSRMTSSEKLALYQKLCAEDEAKAKVNKQ